MPNFTIMAVFEVPPGSPPRGEDVLAGVWGDGHRFSSCDGHTLTLVVGLAAPDPDAATKALVDRATDLWLALGHGELGRPASLRVQAADPDPVPSEAPPGAPEGTGRRKRNKVARELKYFSFPGDDPDGGGLAGVREPRRPRPGPPGSAVAREALPGQDQSAS